ncbi:MAG: hypothetical protein H7122_13010 [Chitinophagaceae bacterium]|nr:hypothetical protein [Chitinophagaceae bacterium]
MNRLPVLILIFAIIHSGCYEPKAKQRLPEKKSRFVFKETIAKGLDTTMVSLGSFKRFNIADVLCQRWRLENMDDITADIIADTEIRKSIVRDMVLFRDSTILENPSGKIRLGRWQVAVKENLRLLILVIPDNSQKQYIIESLTSNQLALGIPAIDHFILDFSAPALTHRNLYYDPFHPVNNRWRIKPLAKETDSAIHERLKNCLLFYALYYRDHIKRKANTISFEGLPLIFEWYSGGIGLPDKDEVDDSWFECFYNREQALQGYSILRKLIVDYEYQWPKDAPSWIYGTHAVLEQMYYKIDDLKDLKKQPRH